MSIEKKLDDIFNCLDSIDNRLDGIDKRLDSIKNKVDVLATIHIEIMNSEIVTLSMKSWIPETRISQLKERVEILKS